MKRVVVIGGDSVIGAAVRERFEQNGVEVAVTSRREGAEYRVDLAEAADRWRLPRECDAAILCAARSRLEDCDEHPKETRRVNVTQTVELARRLSERGAFLIFLSTNLVFRGNGGPFPPTAPTDPVCEYARQKVEVERALSEDGVASAIVRLSKVVHPGMPLLRGWAEALRRGDPVPAFANLRFSPITPSYVAEALCLIAGRRLSGITHLAGSGQISYADFALALARRLGVRTSLVIPTEIPDGPARSSALDAARAASELGVLPSNIAQTIADLFEYLP